MSVVAIVIARMGSARLPGKVMMDLAGQPVLRWVIGAALHAPGVDEVIIATTTEPRDDVIEAWCDKNDVLVYRGPEDDVLARVVGAVATYKSARAVVRLTADCPFLDSQVIGAVVRLWKTAGCAYASNIEPRTWPDGLDVECFSVEAMWAADAEAARPIDRECVTTWIARNRSRFPAENLTCPFNLGHERWVLDTEDDLAFCREVVRHIGKKKPASYLDILRLLDERPHLRAYNAHHPVNERYHEAVANEPIIERTHTRSQAQFERAHQVIPLASQTFSKSHIQFGREAPLFVSHGQGGLVWDTDGNEYVDMVSALLPNVLGYRDCDVDAAIRRQLCSGISFSLATELEAQLAETLCRLIPCAEMVRFAKNGTDVTTAAVRLARAYTGRDKVIICGGYHGWADWTVAGTDRDLGVPNKVARLTDRVPFGTSLDFLHDIAAVVVEPEHDPRYLQYLRERCSRDGAVLIFDEVLTGFRFDLGGAQKLHGVTPDLACFGKAMANGMPLSALVGRADIMRKLEPPNPCAFFSGTFGGEALSLAAAIATIDKLERENVIEKLWHCGRALRQDAERLRDDQGLGNLITFTGEPPLTRLKFRDQTIADTFRRAMIASGTLIIASNNVCWAHTANDMKRVSKSYDHAFAEVRKICAS